MCIRDRMCFIPRPGIRLREHDRPKASVVPGVKPEGRPLPYDGRVKVSRFPSCAIVVLSALFGAALLGTATLASLSLRPVSHTHLTLPATDQV